jgi:hypothetical protein
MAYKKYSVVRAMAQENLVTGVGSPPDRSSCPDGDEEPTILNSL